MGSAHSDCAGVESKAKVRDCTLGFEGLGFQGLGFVRFLGFGVQDFGNWGLGFQD